ncbi:metallophosphoesterase family protein [Methylovulum psychrotolerans]|uniref:3',5'-cyclic adenosine monophosphate phosphodiesterase CpdA n=1 Tax=Methylovulum psychrotolerans TaxID=1704499 RepID=A0A2S5CIB4_9GAMM|nr:metallophosphoesterase [Methylovulum psychrotolerans]POZ50544.1 3',5'-cyclic adenosine monophosphate phosphodiesterase CpdA [Methylovulum psychrotolerans]
MAHEKNYTLRILHISDLHERGPRETESWRRQRVLGATWEHNLEAVTAAGPIDLVCFTGDAADWGKPGEYAAATAFFHAVLKKLSLPPERFFLVPGNHDIDRGLHLAEWQKLRETFSQMDGLTLSRWLRGSGKPPPGADTGWLEPVLARQAAYRQWLTELGREALLPERHDHGRVGYHVCPDFPGLPFPIHITGLDTAWLAGDDHDAQKLWLTDDQIMLHATDKEGNKFPGLRLVLCHHPLWDLADHAAAKNLLAEHADLLLRGHLHNAVLERSDDPDRGLVELAAGCLYEGHHADHYPNGCQLITLQLDGQGRPISVEPWFRAWSERGHWHDDDSRYKQSHQGRLLWPLAQAIARIDPSSNPYDFNRPALPPNFVGRVALMDSLIQALEEGSSVSLVGDRCIGKMSVLKNFEQKARIMARTVVLLRGEGPEAASLSAFVAAITGKACADCADPAADRLAAWVDRVGLPGLPPVLLLDEAEIFLRKFEYRFFERLRGLLDRLCLVLATHQPIDLVFEQLGRGSPFDNKLRIEWLGLLEPAAAEQLVRRGEGKLDGEDQALMRRWAGRHPYFLQLLGYRLAEARRHGKSREWAVDQARSNAYPRLRQLWKTLRNKDKQALRNVATGGFSATNSTFRLRGLQDENGRLFGEVLRQWLEEEDEA